MGNEWRIRFVPGREEKAFLLTFVSMGDTV